MNIPKYHTHSRRIPEVNIQLLLSRIMIARASIFVQCQISNPCSLVYHRNARKHHYPSPPSPEFKQSSTLTQVSKLKKGFHNIQVNSFLLSHVLDLPVSTIIQQNIYIYIYKEGIHLFSKSKFKRFILHPHC